MSSEDSTVSDAPNPDPSSGDFLVTGTPAPVCVNVHTSNEEEAKNSDKDSESLLAGDTNSVEGQNNDEAENNNTECDPIAVNNTPKTDIPPRGRSLKKENPTGPRNRGSSPLSLTGSAKMIALRKGLLGRRRHPTPYPNKHRRHNAKE
ncbi:unnamed protein product [Cercopithifilaria johnstoni]|uniref:Uncharacterized protein n=1 Tax=Cercopithifilaria johnstoni TaxID=2874296 RepID=A0A8J2LVD2_9BILA|nr:unnamed protein product [Cercopithifilaria johnstoni]